MDGYIACSCNILSLPLRLHQKLDLSEISEPGKANENEANNDVVYDLQSIVIHRGEYGSGESNDAMVRLVVSSVVSFSYPFVCFLQSRTLLLLC